MKYSYLKENKKLLMVSLLLVSGFSLALSPLVPIFNHTPAINDYRNHEESPTPTKEETPLSEPISQDEVIAKVKAFARVGEENLRIERMELRPLTKDEITFIQEWLGVEWEPSRLVWFVTFTELFIDIGPRSGTIILDAYNGEILYGLLLD